MTGGRTARALLVLKIALSAGLMAYLIGRIPLGTVGTSLRGADPVWLAGAVALLIASNVLGSWQWERLLRAVDIRIPFWKVCAYYHVGLFFNNFLPANIGGDIARVLDASRYGRGRGTALSTVVMDRLIGTLALAGLAAVTALPVIDRFHLGLVYLAVAAFLMLSLLALWVALHPRVQHALERLLGALGWRGALGGHVAEFGERMAAFRGRRRLLLGLLSIALVVQVMRVAVHAVVARALGMAVPLPYFFLFVPLLAVIVSLPISLNGIGVREGAGILLFGLVGVGQAQAFSLQFTTYLVAVAVSLLGGLVFFGRMPRRAGAREQVRRSS